MSYTVVWLKSAEADLASYWVQARDRQAVANAADEIDSLLCKYGARAGSAIDAQRWRLRIPPLTVDFDASEEDLKISIVDIRIDSDALSS
jgi:hypothetical protein